MAERLYLNGHLEHTHAHINFTRPNSRNPNGDLLVSMPIENARDLTARLLEILIEHAAAQGQSPSLKLSNGQIVSFS